MYAIRSYYGYRFVGVSVQGIHHRGVLSGGTSERPEETRADVPSAGRALVLSAGADNPRRRRRHCGELGLRKIPLQDNGEAAEHAAVVRLFSTGSGFHLHAR